MSSQHPRPSAVRTGGRFSSREPAGRAIESTVPAGGDSVPWPALEWEQQTWQLTPGEWISSRDRRAGRGYRSAIPAAIADQRTFLPGWLTADLDAATAAIARFDAQHATPSFAALTAMLLRTESASSSQIEQITASARAVAEAEFTGEGVGNAAVVAGNVKAMNAALGGAGPIDAHRIAQVQRVLLESHAPQLVGWRQEPVWVGGRGSTPMTADYVGPDHHRISAAIDDLAAFLERDDLPALAQAAIAHAQFETIHPFADGNGRTGRALVHLVLRGKGLARSVTVPVSAGLLLDKARYFAALGDYRTGDAQPIISVFVAASIHAVAQGEQFDRQLQQVQSRWKEQITARSDSAVWRVLKILPQHPVADGETLAAAAGYNPRNIYRALQPLLDTGILMGSNHHRSRRFLYRSPDVLGILDQYAHSFGRR